MKSLYLVRHGHAESKAKHPDASRNLDEEGRREVAKTGNALKERGIVPSLIISSHANRAYQTAEIIADILGYDPGNIKIEKGIYYTDAEAVEEVIRHQDENLDSILLTGHNPSISWLADKLSVDFDEDMPTAGLVAFGLDSESWQSFRPGKCKYLFHYFGD